MEKKRVITGRDFVDLWKQHSLWIILLMVAYAYDTLSTIHFMTREEIYYELHPLVRHSAIIFGPVIGTILSAFVFKSIAALFLALYLKQMRIWVLTAPIIPAIIAGYINFS